MARILVTGFCSLPAPDRPGAQMRHVVSGLLRHHQVDVLALRRHEQAHLERVRSARILRVPVPSSDLHGRVEAFRRALRRQLEGADYDVVHFRDGWSGLTVLDLKRRQGYATVFDVARSPMAEPVLTDLATATELERAEESCVRRADLVLAPSEPARQYLSGLADESKVHVVPPGVNVDAFDWEHPPVAGPPVVLYLGALSPGRGVRVLLRAMYDVAALSDAVLVLAGPAPPDFRSSLELAISELSLGQRVRILGEIPHDAVPLLISRSTVCVAPGAAELEPKPTALYPTKLLEYLACQRAVVAPKRGSVAMLVRDGQQGLLFEPGSPEDLARKILLLIGDSGLRQRLACSGYELVRRTCTAAGTRRALHSAYSWLLSQEPFRRSPATLRSELESVPAVSVALGRERASGAEERIEGDTAPFDKPVPPPPADDVTQVEVRPATEVAFGERPSDWTDEWVVGRASAGLAVSSTESEAARVDLGDLGRSNDPGTVVIPPLDNAPVVGELVVNEARPEHAEPLAELSAVMAPLGRTEEREQEARPTRIVERPTELDEERAELQDTGVRQPALGASGPPEPPTGRTSAVRGGGKPGGDP